MLNKSHCVAGFCAAVFALAAHWSEELTCYVVENYTFHPRPSVLQLSQLLCRTEPSTAVPFTSMQLEFDVFTALFYLRPRGATL